MKEGQGENRYIADCFIRRGKKKNQIERGNPYQIPAPFTLPYVGSVLPFRLRSCLEARHQPRCSPKVRVRQPVLSRAHAHNTKMNQSTLGLIGAPLCKEETQWTRREFHLPQTTMTSCVPFSSSALTILFSFFFSFQVLFTFNMLKGIEI